jgi:carboxylesterase type B
MSSYWVNFALYGNPNDPSPSRKFPVWPVYEIQSNRYLEIGETIKPMINLRLHEYGAIDKFLRERGMMHF